MLLDRYINQLIDAYDAMFEARRTFSLLREAGVLDDLGLNPDAQPDDLNCSFDHVAHEIAETLSVRRSRDQYMTRVAAVKRVREVTNIGLKEAKELVDTIRQTAPPKAQPTQ
jgi:hypothetical protein